MKPADRLNLVQEYYFSRKLKEVAKLNAEGKDIISLAIGSPDMPPSQQTIDKLAEVASQPSAHGYQPTMGTPELRKAMANFYKKWYDVDVNADTEVLPLIGSKEGILHITLALCNPGDKVRQDFAIDVATVLLPDMKQFEKENKELAPQLQMSATDVDFTDFGGKTKKTATVTLQNTGVSPLKITSLQLFTAGLKVTLSKSEIAPGQSANLKITGIAEELQKLRTRPRILMITNDPDHAKVVVNIKLQ